MGDEDQGLDDVLGQTAWIRGLARRLVTDAAERDDVVQQVWVETLRKGSRARALRPWLTADRALDVAKKLAAEAIRAKSAPSP